MQLFNLKDYTGGWVIGDFDPALFHTKDIEIGIKSYLEGSYEQRHTHKIVTEYTIIVKGSVIMNNTQYDTGDIIRIDPEESTDFLALKDTITCVIKTPSIPSDKYLV
jgi:anti-sigma factor ChrR (cupin superfamily)